MFTKEEYKLANKVRTIVFMMSAIPCLTLIIGYLINSEVLMLIGGVFCILITMDYNRIVKLYIMELLRGR